MEIILGQDDRRSGKDRRLGIERRIYSYSGFAPERRSGNDRRSGFDRRFNQ